MASIDRNDYPWRLGFSRFFRKRRKVSPTERCGAAADRPPSFFTPKFSSCRQQQQQREEFPPIASDSDTEMPPKISLFCCGSRSTRNTKSKSNGLTVSLMRSKTCDECSMDTVDSNNTTKSVARDPSMASQTPSIQRLRSRVASFYSVISFNEGESPFNFRSARSSPSSFKTGRSRTVVDDSDEFFSVYGDEEFIDGDTSFNKSSPEGSLATSSSQPLMVLNLSSLSTSGSLCACGFGFHSSIFNPEFPLITPPGIIPDSHEEAVAIASAFQGRWETLVDRSESLDSQYRAIGLGMVKRAVMNRLAIPLTMFLEENNTILHCWVHTPLGIRHMRANLCHEEAVDDDPDAGRWSGVTHVVDFSVPWFCDGKPVRAIQNRRQNPKVGNAIETRVVLPDAAEGKVMLFQFIMTPNSKKKNAEVFKADRILKYMGPKEE